MSDVAVVVVDADAAEAVATIAVAVVALGAAVAAIVDAAAQIVLATDVAVFDELNDDVQDGMGCEEVECCFLFLLVGLG